MNYNSRLVDSSRNPLARELLRSADLDEPPDHSLTRLAVALGLGSSAVITTVATSAAATTGLAAGTGTATGVSATATVSAGTGAAIGSGVVASSAVLSSVGGAAVAAGAAPVVGGAVTALGMLKAMAVVSLTCGTLSFGGTKLAMTIADNPVAASATVAPTYASTKAANAPALRARANGTLSAVAAPPAPPESDVDFDVVTAESAQEASPVDVSNEGVQHAATERNVGRQDINSNSAVNPTRPALESRDAFVPPVVAAAGEHRVAAVAAFPMDEEPPASAVANNQPGTTAPKQPKTPKVAADTDLEREVSLLDRARGALASGQPLVALQALNAYRTQPHRGTLHAESVVLRVKALLALGQHSAAEREAYPLINAAPQSRHAARLRELLGVPVKTP